MNQCGGFHPHTENTLSPLTPQVCRTYGHYTETAVQYGRFCGRGNSPYVDIKRSMQAKKTTIHVLHTMKSHVLTIHPFVLASMDS